MPENRVLKQTTGSGCQSYGRDPRLRGVTIVGGALSLECKV
jgi:hypothetical protein